MFDLVSSNGMMQSMDRGMTLATRRMELIASNMANIDTPGYHTKDFDFASALKAELDRTAGPSVSMARTDSKHLSGSISGPNPSISDPMSPAYERNDGNDVSLDRESMMLARTQSNYQLASNFAQSELRKIYQVLRDGSR
jgi:flagellar basal-body rod protein FlgB